MGATREACPHAVGCYQDLSILGIRRGITHCSIDSPVGKERDTGPASPQISLARLAISLLVHTVRYCIGKRETNVLAMLLHAFPHEGFIFPMWCWEFDEQKRANGASVNFVAWCIHCRQYQRPWRFISCLFNSMPNLRTEVNHCPYVTNQQVESPPQAYHENAIDREQPKGGVMNLAMPLTRTKQR